MLQPKFSFDKQKRKYVAQKEFTDREQPQETFLRNLNELSERLLSNIENPHDVKPHVLVYYGVGGIGKTTLKNKLKQTVFEISNSISIEIDFKNVRSRECGAGLLDMANSVKLSSNTKKIYFPHFELAYAIYFKKKYPDVSFSKENESLFSKHEFGIELLSFFDPIGVIGITKSVVDQIYKHSKNIVLNQDMKEYLKKFEMMSLSEMEEWLPAYFGNDLNKYLEKNNEVKIIVFVDTFESLYEFGTHELKRIEKDNWLKELILSVPNVLFSIFGRNKISWKDEWGNYLDQHLLSELTIDYTIDFLIKCGVEEDDIREKIANVSGGHPYYLDLSVDTYFSIKNSGSTPTIDFFGNVKNDILDRFVRNLHDVEIELLKLMCIPNYFNCEIFTLLIEAFRIPYSPTQFSSFNQYSFITENESIKKYYIHQLMREGMDEYNTDPILKSKANKVLLDFYEEKYQSDKRNYLFECIYHKLKLSNSVEFFNWIISSKIDFIIHLQILGETVLLSNIFGQIISKYSIKDFDIKLFNIYEDMVHLSGSYKEAVEMSECYLNNFNENTIFNNNELIRLKFRIIHHKMFYQNSDELISELLLIRDKISLDDFFVEYCEVTYMLGGGVGFLTGQLEKSKEYLDCVVSLIEEKKESNKKLQNLHIRAIRKIVDYHRVVGNLDKAKEICNNYLDTNELDRYQIYLLCSCGEIYRARGEYVDARKSFEKVLNETKKLGIKGWTAHAYLSLANVHIDLGEYSQAKILLDLARPTYEEISNQWGIVNGNIMYSRILLCENEDSAYKVLNQTRTTAELYGYRYEIKLIDDIISTNNIGKQELLYV